MSISNLQSLMEETLASAKAGNRPLAELHFRSLMQESHGAVTDPAIWFLMAWLAPSPQAMRQPLQHLLALDPDNDLARLGLRWAEGIAHLTPSHAQSHVDHEFEVTTICTPSKVTFESTVYAAGGTTTGITAVAGQVEMLDSVLETVRYQFGAPVLDLDASVAEYGFVPLDESESSIFSGVSSASAKLSDENDHCVSATPVASAVSQPVVHPDLEGLEFSSPFSSRSRQSQFVDLGDTSRTIKSSDIKPATSEPAAAKPAEVKGFEVEAPAVKSTAVKLAELKARETQPRDAKSGKPSKSGPLKDRGTSKDLTKPSTPTRDAVSSELSEIEATDLIERLLPTSDPVKAVITPQVAPDAASTTGSARTEGDKQANAATKVDDRVSERNTVSVTHPVDVTIPTTAVAETVVATDAVASKSAVAPTVSRPVANRSITNDSITDRTITCKTSASSAVATNPIPAGTTVTKSTALEPTATTAATEPEPTKPAAIPTGSGQGPSSQVTSGQAAGVDAEDLCQSEEASEESLARMLEAKISDSDDHSKYDKTGDSNAARRPGAPSILVVDDSPTVRKLLTMMLTQGGYEVTSAVDGLDAVQSIATHVPQLIITDINMPRLDGYKLCKLVTRNVRTKHIPVVMISAGIIDRLRGKLAGCSGYLAKPITPGSLNAVVEFALQESSVR